MTALTLSPAPLTPAEEAACDHAERLARAFADLTDLLPPGTILRRDEPMARRTTLRVGGPADLLVEPAEEAGAAVVLQVARLHGLPVFRLGRGSNLLVRDGGIRGVVLSLLHPGLSGVRVEGERLHCGAGAPLRQVANAARDAGLTGLEFLEGIPGSVGGALRMNAGAMGGWIFDRVETVRYLTPFGEVREIAGAEAGAVYRGCPLFPAHVALGAVLRGEPAPGEQIAARMQASNQKRWTSQPRQPSAGCTFKNPAPDRPAGRLLDSLGLKGTRVGGAMISDVHANFFVNTGPASARDVLDLIDLARGRVREACGIELEPEVEIVGED